MYRPFGTGAKAADSISEARHPSGVPPVYWADPYNLRPTHQAGQDTPCVTLQDYSAFPSRSPHLPGPSG
ncbi:hypothetical protein GCM10012280_44890 [Wenjunlia tyrosinilytica]|uniref:Uncharacterized protein n=1 Tax=Wenjunlia tyrosinilytica TaxID=1544741 RepID=A0A917ZUN6_9ACTN|nr:hypothetical protein GCM10012280_44890 [Wenjunlia tyrosinilytica]